MTHIWRLIRLPTFTPMRLNSPPARPPDRPCPLWDTNSALTCDKSRPVPVQRTNSHLGFPGRGRKLRARCWRCALQSPPPPLSPPRRARARACARSFFLADALALLPDALPPLEPPRRVVVAPPVPTPAQHKVSPLTSGSRVTFRDVGGCVKTRQLGSRQRLESTLPPPQSLPASHRSMITCVFQKVTRLTEYSLHV